MPHSKTQSTRKFSVIEGKFAKMFRQSFHQAFHLGIQDIRLHLEKMMHILIAHPVYLTVDQNTAHRQTYRLSYYSKRHSAVIDEEINLAEIYQMAISGLLNRISFPGFRWIDSIDCMMDDQGNVVDNDVIPIDPSTGDVKDDTKVSMILQAIQKSCQSQFLHLMIYLQLPLDDFIKIPLFQAMIRLEMDGIYDSLFTSDPRRMYDDLGYYIRLSPTTEHQLRELTTKHGVPISHPIKRGKYHGVFGFDNDRESMLTIKQDHLDRVKLNFDDLETLYLQYLQIREFRVYIGPFSIQQQRDFLLIMSEGVVEMSMTDLGIASVLKVMDNQYPNNLVTAYNPRLLMIRLTPMVMMLGADNPHVAKAMNTWVQRISNNPQEIGLIRVDERINIDRLRTDTSLLPTPMRLKMKLHFLDI